MATVIVDKAKVDRKTLWVGILIGALTVLVVVSIAFAVYKTNTAELNDVQRFRAVCEAAGGIVADSYCVKGAEVLPIKIN